MRLLGKRATIPCPVSEPEHAFPAPFSTNDDKVLTRSERGCLCIIMCIYPKHVLYAIAMSPLNSPPSPHAVTELLPDLIRADDDPLLDALDAVEGGSDVQCKHGLTIRCGWSRVVVDHVPYFLPRAWSPDDPVMAIKGRLGAATWFRRTHTRRSRDILESRGQ